MCNLIRLYSRLLQSQNRHCLGEDNHRDYVLVLAGLRNRSQERPFLCASSARPFSDRSFSFPAFNELSLTHYWVYGRQVVLFTNEAKLRGAALSME